MLPDTTLRAADYFEFLQRFRVRNRFLFICNDIKTRLSELERIHSRELFSLVYQESRMKYYS